MLDSITVNLKSHFWCKNAQIVSYTSQALEGKPTKPKVCLFGRKSLPTLQFHYGWIFLPISFFTENWKVLPSILMTSFGWKTLPKHPFHCKFGIRLAVQSQG